MVREIIVDWTGPGAGGKLNVFYFDEATAVATQRAALDTFMTSISDRLDNAMAWTVRTVGRELNAGTGALVDEWSESTSQTGTGTSIGQATADATQVLVRWNTGVVVSGRFLKGRTFIPGLEVNEITDGNLGAGAVGDFNTAAAALVTAAVGLQVWHRPVNGAGGVAHDVVSGSVWNELAVLRRRRG